MLFYTSFYDLYRIVSFCYNTLHYIICYHTIVYYIWYVLCLFFFFLERERETERAAGWFRGHGKILQLSPRTKPCSLGIPKSSKEHQRTRFKGQLMMGKHWQNQGLITSICRNLRWHNLRVKYGKILLESMGHIMIVALCLKIMRFWHFKIANCLISDSVFSWIHVAFLIKDFLDLLNLGQVDQNTLIP